MADDLARYARQVRFGPLGEEGQRRLQNSTALIAGCGALGSMAADWLVRAGVGRVRLVDRDLVDLTNLHRQVLFDERDAAAATPKAVAAAARLQQINSTVALEPTVADIGPTSIDELAAGCDAIVDGTDNFETRFLLNDYALKHGVPWIYAGCVGAEGQVMAIRPGQTACLRCLLDDCPSAGSVETCDSAGIVPPVVGVIASLEAAEAIKLLSGHQHDVGGQLTVVDVWSGRMRQLHPKSNPDCPACRGDFPWLDGRRGSRASVLCGRNAVQLAAAADQRPNLTELAERLSGIGRVSASPHLVRLVVEAHEIVVFADGRTLVFGTNDATTARGLVARYIGQ